jgi:hypothetical protein
VRDPIARAYSNHKHEVRIGHLQGKDLSFEAGLKNNPAYVEQGLYGRHLKRWLAVLSGEQIQVVRFEDVVYDPASVMKAVCDFLRIGPMPAGARLSEKSNESYLVRHDSFEAVKNVLRSTVRALGLGEAWQLLGDTGLRARYRRLNRVAPESSIGAPAPGTIENLRQLFRPDVEEFGRLTGLTLNDWLRQ